MQQGLGPPRHHCRLIPVVLPAAWRIYHAVQILAAAASLLLSFCPSPTTLFLMPLDKKVAEAPRPAAGGRPECPAPAAHRHRTRQEGILRRVARRSHNSEPGLAAGGPTLSAPQTR